RSEFLLDKGMIDLVVDRRELKATIAQALQFMGAVPIAIPEPATATIPPAEADPVRNEPAPQA
ncbi:MAG: acetyl-CoA carboxylase carboxyl transferase subunit beta, partial [Acidobacteria bacterium]|nr:acetyl-CoA carboxylase carboxyl transferase subunit beta [Acidobacteriota bacterium]